MTTLTEFLLAHPVDDVTHEVPVSKRLKDEDGTLLKFKVKPMLNSQFLEYQKQCMITGKNGKVEFNTKRFNQLIILNHTIEPNFRSTELISKAGVTTPEQLVDKFLLAGEIQNLSEQIRNVSGFDETVEDLVEEVKN